MFVDKPSAGRSVIHWSASIQHVVSFTRTVHRVEDTMYSTQHGGHHVLYTAWRTPCTLHCMEDTMYSTLHGGCMRTCSGCKNCQFFQYQVEVKQFKFRSTSADTTRWQHLGLVQHKIAKTVSSFSLQ